MVDLELCIQSRLLSNVWRHDTNHCGVIDNSILDESWVLYYYKVNIIKRSYEENYVKSALLLCTCLPLELVLYFMNSVKQHFNPWCMIPRHNLKTTRLHSKFLLLTHSKPFSARLHHYINKPLIDLSNKCCSLHTTGSFHHPHVG